MWIVPARKKLPSTFGTVFALVLLSIAPHGFGTSIAHADEEDPGGWHAKGRIQLVDTRGNGESTTAGLDLALTRTGDRAEIEVAVGGLLVENTTLERSAVGSVDDFVIEESENQQTPAENAYFSLEYQFALSESVLFVSGGRWERDELAGFTDRYSAHLGLGLATKGSKGGCLETSLSASWIRQDDLVVADDTVDEYPGLRLLTRYSRNLGENSRFESTWQIDGNLDDQEDVRSDWSNAFRVSVNRWISFEIEARWLYDSRPALELIPLDDGSDIDPPLEVPAPLDENQTRFTIALVLLR